MSKPIYTIIIDPDTGKILQALSGPKHLHTIGNFQVAIEYSGSLINKIGAEIDGEWQVIDDVEKIIESAMVEKISEVTDHKESILKNGYTTSGEINTGGQWTASQVTVNYDSKTRRNIERIKRHAGKTDPLKGRPSIAIIVGKKARIKFSTMVEIFDFVESYEDRFDTAHLIESEKIQEIIELQTVEEISSYDAASGWEELNG